MSKLDLNRYNVRQKNGKSLPNQTKRIKKAAIRREIEGLILREQNYVHLINERSTDNERFRL